MYKKEVRINWKKYCNLREDRVKNNCLGRDRKLYLNVFEFRLIKKEKKKPWVLINQDKVKRWYEPFPAKLKYINANLYINFSEENSNKVEEFVEDDNLVIGAVVDEKEKKKTESHNLVIQTESVAYPKLKSNNDTEYKKFSVLKDLENAGVAQLGTAADLRSVAYPGLRVRNLGFESNSEIPSSSVQK